MQNNKISINDLDIEDREEAILALFDPDEREFVAAKLATMDISKLTDESLDLFLIELNSLGSIGSSLVAVSRENHDLREKLKKERRMVIVGAVCILLCLALIGLLLSLFAVYPKYKVFQTVDNSIICEIKPEKNPQLTDVAIQDFAKLAVLHSYSFDYINYRDTINTATTRYFTSEGRAAFNKALRTSGSLDHIISNNLIMKSVVKSAPQIEEKGIDVQGRKYWVVRMPVAIEFYTGQSKPADTQNFVAQVRLVTTERDAFNEKGLGVFSLTLRPYREGR